MNNKLFFALIYSDNALVDSVKNKITKQFGDICLESESYAFSHSNYYENEMGPNLKRVFFGLDITTDPNNFWKLKTWSESIEAIFKNESGQRQINLDPGILQPHNMIFLTTKNFAHRLPLEGNIFAEVSLIFKDKAYHSLPWSYPDLSFNNVQSFFKNLRKLTLNSQ